MLLEPVISFFNTPFPNPNDHRSRWTMVLLPGIFTALFLNIFQPFTIHNPSGNFQFMIILSGYGLVTSILLYFNEFVIQNQFPSFFQGPKWTIGKNLFWFGWHFISISFGIYAYWKYWCCGWNAILNLEGYPLMLFRTIAIGIFPLIAHMTWQWIKSLDSKANQLSDSGGSPQETVITLNSEYHNEQLRLSSSRLLFLESADNYVAVHYKEGDSVTKKLIRSSLSRIESELEHLPNFIRCHRSFIINLDQVESIKGNSKKLEAHIRELNNPIPIARKKAVGLQKRLAALSG